MRINIEFDSNDHVDEPSVKRFYRSVAASLLNIIGELHDAGDDAPEGTSAPPAPPAPPLNGYTFGEASSSVPPPPPPPPPVHVSNVVNFPVPPPPPPPPVTSTSQAFSPAGSPPIASTAAVPIPSAPPAPPAPAAAALSGAASALDYDSANVAWDERIHQKGKNKKGDGTWKLRKQVGASPEQVAAFNALTLHVLQEQAAHKVAGTFAPPPPPPPPSVSLPPTVPVTGAVFVPPPPPPPPVGAVFVPPPPPPVSVQGGASNGSASNGAVPAPPSEFKQLMDGFLAAKVPPQDVAKICQYHGAPNLMELNKREDLFPAVKQTIEKIAQGIPLEMILANQA